MEFEEKYSYRGWHNCLRLSNKEKEFKNILPGGYIEHKENWHLFKAEFLADEKTIDSILLPLESDFTINIKINSITASNI